MSKGRRGATGRAVPVVLSLQASLLCIPQATIDPLTSAGATSEVLMKGLRGCEMFSGRRGRATSSMLRRARLVLQGGDGAVLVHFGTWSHILNSVSFHM